MPRILFALLPLTLLGGCAGYAADYWQPKQSLIAQQLPRYGLSAAQSQCVGPLLTKSLSVWQLRQFADLAKRLTPGGQNPAALGPRDFLYIAGLVKDPAVKTETGRALAACGAGADAPVQIATAVPASDSPAPAPAETPAGGGSIPTVVAPPAALPLWVNLGTAPTGQFISVDAASLENAPGWRRGWFRLSDPGQPGPGTIAYRLRIDCVDQAITALAGRKYGPTGAITEQKDYAAPEGPLAIEAGTVMEIAYRALCT